MISVNTGHTPDFSELTDIVYTLGDRVKQEMFQNLKIEEKPGDELVTRIDRLIELEARKLIKAQYGAVNFLGEEFPDEDNGSAITFIIDPLDGTESFIYREFNTTISIGVEIGGKLVHGLVYDFMKDMLYEGGTESSQYMMKKPIPFLRRVNSEKIRILVSGRGPGVEETQRILKEDPRIQVTRAYGSVALQTVQTGAGNYEGYIRDGKIKKWDIAGGAPFIQSIDDTSILSREGNTFDHNTPETGVIVVRHSFQDEFLRILNV